MRQRRCARQCGCWEILRGAPKWPRRESNYANCTVGLPRGIWRSADDYCQHPVDFLEILLAQRAGGRLQAQVIEDGVVARKREVALGGKKLLLRVEDIDVDPDADLIAELVRVERALRGHLRLLERRDLSDAVQGREVKLAGGQHRSSPRVLHIVLRALVERRSLTLARRYAAALENRQLQL